MKNTDDFKERFKRWKNGENYWAIRADRDQYLPQYSDGKPKKQYYPVYDAAKYFALDGVKAVMSSGQRPGAVVADTGRPSQHAILGGAADYVGDFENMIRVIRDPNSNTYKWMMENDIDWLNEDVSHGGTMAHWPKHRIQEYLAGGRSNNHLHFFKSEKKKRQRLENLKRDISNIQFKPDFITKSESPVTPTATVASNPNKIYGPIELPNVNVTRDIRAAIQKMDEEKRNRALDEITRFGPLPNPIAFFNSFWGEDLPTRQTLNKPIV